MSLLNRLFGDKTPPPQVRSDWTFGHPGTRMIQVHARRGEWQKVRDALAKESDNALRARYVDVCVAEEGADRWIEQWLENEPESGNAWLLAGIRSLERGDEIRGAAKAEDVPEERWDPFHELTMDAEEELLRAAELSPSDPLPMQNLLNTAMTLGAPVDVRMKRFEEGRRRDPSYHGTHFGIMTALTKKWGGSHEQMFRVARESASTAPAGTAIPAVLASAHVERWLYIHEWERDDARSRTYFDDKQVRAEIMETHRATREVPKSVEIWVANVYSFCFFQIDKKAAKEEFRRAGGLYSGPWMYLGMDAYSAALERCWSA